jgi:hypothetical protein
MNKNIYFVIYLLFCVNLLSGQGIQYTDISSNANVDYVGLNVGMSFGDYDNDGDEDLYVVTGEKNKLYQNQGNGTFTEVGLLAGVRDTSSSLCSTWGDVNNDGFLDLYVGNFNMANRLYLNNGDGTFSDITVSAGVGNTNDPRSLMMVDYDNDGFLDLYVANLGKQNVLYKNNGDNTFSDVTIASGATDYGIAMGSVFFDYDNDGDQDLYLTHDNYNPCILYQNQGNGTFWDVSQASGTNVSAMAMGVDFGDFNNDGFFDLYVTNLGNNFLLKNNGDGTFTDIAFDAGIDDNGMGWGTYFLDVDNDGLQDLYMINNSNFIPKPNALYHNLGNDSFAIVSTNTDLESRYNGIGGASADIDNDGRIDIAISNIGGIGNQLFQNTTVNNNNWIKIKTEGTVSNRAGIGSRVEIFTNGWHQMNEVASGRSYCSGNSLIMHFGVGTATNVDSVRVSWSSGQVDVYPNMEVNKHYLATEETSLTPILLSNTTSPELAKIKAKAFPNPFTHTTSLTFTLEKSEQVAIHVYNSMGQVVKTLTQENLTSGEHYFSWNGTTTNGAKLPSGTYFYTIEIGEKLSVGQLILVR